MKCPNNDEIAPTYHILNPNEYFIVITQNLGVYFRHSQLGVYLVQNHYER